MVAGIDHPTLARARSVFDDLMAQDIVVRNPAALVKSLPTEKSAMHTLSAEQATAFADGDGW